VQAGNKKRKRNEKKAKKNLPLLLRLDEPAAQHLRLGVLFRAREHADLQNNRVGASDVISDAADAPGPRLGMKWGKSAPTG
jgi:hypothetical protein